MKTFNFSVALALLKQGQFVGRTAWKDGFVFMVAPTAIPVASVGDPGLAKAITEAGHTEFLDVGNIRMFFEGQGTMINGWTPGIVDLMSEDWTVKAGRDSQNPPPEGVSTKEFHRTIIKVDVLSEYRLDGMTMDGIFRQLDDGDFVGRHEVVGTAQLNGKEMADALRELRSDPGFFQLDDDGKDTA